MKGEQFIFLNL